MALMVAGAALAAALVFRLAAGGDGADRPA
jgi:hypothetical protein